MSGSSELDPKVAGEEQAQDPPERVAEAEPSFFAQPRRIAQTLLVVLILAGIVFVAVEGFILYAVFRYRRRPGDDVLPEQLHGNTTIEIIWTLIPALILAAIAVPTVKGIFETNQTPPGAVKVEVIGHQWWWEFRYPQYGVVTANELYLPVGRTVDFALTTADVLHSFWIPQLGGKRDLVSNDTNHVWFTPERAFAWNGFCAEYCGSSHANMRFRVFTVPPEQFE